jgi:hypothetical protein
VKEKDKTTNLCACVQQLSLCACVRRYLYVSRMYFTVHNKLQESELFIMLSESLVQTYFQNGRGGPAAAAAATGGGRLSTTAAAVADTS